MILALLMATISLFGTASFPADNGSNVGQTVTITPPANMTAGMLVLATLQVRQTGIGWVEIFPSATGGQTWQECSDTAGDPTTFSNTNIGGRNFYCIFNGTWTGSLTFDCTAATAVTGKLDVFQLNDPLYTWDYDVMPVYTTFAAPGSPFTVTIAAMTTLTDGAVMWAGVLTADDNTWDTLTGSGWANIGGTQIRNTSATGQSMWTAYKVVTTAGSSGTVSMNQATLGGDAGVKFSMVIKAVQKSVVEPTSRPTVDVIVDHEASVDGTVITPAILTGCTEPGTFTGGAWVATGGVATAITIATPSELKLSQQRGINIGAQPDDRQGFDDANATRGAAYNHLLGAETPSYNFEFTTTKSKVSMGFLYRTNYQLGLLASYSSMALFSDPSGEFTVFNLLSQFSDRYVTRLECNLAPGLIVGPQVFKDRTYWITMLMDTTAAKSKMAVFDVTADWARLGFTVVLPIDGSQLINRLQTYCTGGGYVAGSGVSSYDDIVLDWTTAAFPLLPGSGGTPFPPANMVPLQLRM